MLFLPRGVHAVRFRSSERAVKIDDRRLFPSDDTLAMITRYEAHLHRQYIQTLHELEALQTRRSGGHAPLARLDISGPPS